MSEKGIEVMGPVGRIVWGHPTKPQPKKHMDGPQKGQPIIGPDGQPVMQWSFGYAIPVAEFQQHVWPAMAAEAATGYPNGVPPRFSWKMKQEGEIDNKGQPYGQREGYAGHVVLTVTSNNFAPQVVRFNPQTGQYDAVAADQIKPGDYVAVKLNFKVNVATGTNTPSLYVNPVIVDFVGHGKEIVSQGAVNPMEALGGRQYQLPPGASATPVSSAPLGTAMPGAPMAQPQPGQPMQMPGQTPQYQSPQPMQMPPGAPMAQPQPGQPVTQQPAPAHDYVQGHGYQAPQPMQMPPGQPAPMQYQQPPGAPMAQPGQPMGMPGQMPPRA